MSKDGSAMFFPTLLSDAVKWARKNSLWPMPFGTSCCGIELMSTLSSTYDLSRFGAEVVRFSPRLCDMIIVAGTITTKMAPELRTIYDQMLEPKWVIAMGACSSSGGIFDTYSVLQGIDEIMPQLANIDQIAFLNIIVRRGARKDLGRPTLTPLQNKQIFGSFIQK